MTDETAFDPVGPLPSGRVVLEASAGTGKTWTIAALATRYVAEAGLAIEEILVVTFTRAATSELRGRVRDRLSEAARFLESDRDAASTDDAVHRHLAATDPETRQIRARRLRVAATNFDRATITTLHGFAQRLLIEFGFLSGVRIAGEVVADRSDLVADVVNHMYLDGWANRTQRPLPLSELNEIAAAVLLNHDAEILPDKDTVSGAVRTRSRFASRLRERVAEQSIRRGVVAYDDLLVMARDALGDPSVRELTSDLISDRYRVALVDEFQDTDRIQWEIVDSLFTGSSVTLLIIGDPKQSIYAFRGADIAAYLDASQHADSRYTLATNWRSDGPLLQAIDALFSGMEFGDESIVYRTVTAAPGRTTAGITHVDAPVEIRLIGHDAPVRQNRDGWLGVAAAREFIANDVAATIVDLLSTPAEISTSKSTNVEAFRSVKPGDIAVLCRTGREVLDVAEALRKRGVPSVSGRAGSVLTSEAAQHWLTLLAALEFPSSSLRARSAALTPMFGWTPKRLRDATDQDLLPLQERLIDWSRLLGTHGVAALWREVERCTDVTARVLSTAGGERLATDLDHLNEILHAAGRIGVRSLFDWLSSETDRARHEQEDSDVLARRLETDADAVQVLTIHGAKGLEFPIVMAPFLWNTFASTQSVPVMHPEDSHRRAVDVGGQGWPGFEQSQERAVAEAAAEELRLMYVALTRARHHLVVWWAKCHRAETAPLTRLLFGRGLDATAPKQKIVLGTDDRLAAALSPIVDAGNGTVTTTWLAAEPSSRRWESPGKDPVMLSAAAFDRELDRLWRRSSFSGITAPALHAHPSADPGELAALDEPEPSELDPEVSSSLPDELPMGEMVGGAAFGTLVHSVLERVEFAAPDLRTQLQEVTGREVGARGIDVDPIQLAAALEGVIATPLGLDAHPRLADLASEDMAVEMRFEMPIASDTSDVGVVDIAEVIGNHLGPAHPLGAYPDRLRAMEGERFRGFMTGAIDLVARHGPAPAYWVIDHKTNQLHPRGEVAAIEHYSTASMARAMVDGDYVLQALIYQVALHRYLRMRVQGYQIDRHLGGSRYLFLRGMVGVATPISDGGRHGVFTWAADPDLINDLDRLFSEGRRT